MEFSHHSTNISSSSSSPLSSPPVPFWWQPSQHAHFNGFWFPGTDNLRRTLKVVDNFKPQSRDVILASFPKTGTTWLKSLLYAITHSSSLDSLNHNHPHLLVPSLELLVFAANPAGPAAPSDESGGTRIFNTHIPYQVLSGNLNSSDCKVVYVTRNPKDTVVSLFHYVKKSKTFEEAPWTVEEAADQFCKGVVPYGPYYEHVLGYRKESLENPKKVFFVTYEELKGDPNAHVKRLAEFLGCPVGEEAAEEIVRRCSFGELSNAAVNKSGDMFTWLGLPNNSFFRKGEVGDYANFLSPETIRRIDDLTVEKFHKAGFMYGI
nr:cytosolic sulfotransferase 5-like [Ipomoea trifida]